MDHTDTLRALDLPTNLLKPSRHDLDTAFERHPDDIALVADALAQAKMARDEFSATRDGIKARVRRELNEQHKGDKLTVADIGARVDVDPEVRATLRDSLAHDLLVEQLAALLKGLEAKTSALKHLSELWQSGYYTSSSSRRAEVPARRRVE